MKLRTWTLKHPTVTDGHTPAQSWTVGLHGVVGIELLPSGFILITREIGDPLVINEPGNGTVLVEAKAATKKAEGGARAS